MGGAWKPSSATGRMVNEEEAELEKPEEEMPIYTATHSGLAFLSHLELSPPLVNWSLESQATKLMGPKRLAWTPMQVSGGTFPFVTAGDKRQGSSGRILLGSSSLLPLRLRCGTPP